MVDVEQQGGLGEIFVELLPGALLPSGGEVLCDVGVLGEESVIVGHTQEIEHILNHVEMRDQDRLRDIGSEILVSLSHARPEPWRGAAERFRIQFAEMGSHLQAIKKLKGPELTHGDGAEKPFKVFLAKPQEDIAKLHQGQSNTIE